MVASAIEPAPRRAAPLRPNRRRILVVEEEAGVRLVTRLVLEAAGYTVVEARDGATALGVIAAEEQPFDAVLLDLDLHDVSGFDVGGVLPRMQPGLAVIVCADDQKGRRPPHAAWLCKPYTPHDLLLVAEVVTSLGRRVAVSA
jgi:CheY-like chemotaxis protein